MPSDQWDRESHSRSRSSARNRRRMLRIPEEQEDMLPRATRHWPRLNTRRWVPGRSDHLRRNRGVSPLTLFNINNTDLFNNHNNTNNDSGALNNHRNRNCENEFSDYDCCSQCYFSELMFLCKFCNFPTLKIGLSVPEEEAVPPEDRVRPLQAYVDLTDKVIKELLAEIADCDGHGVTP